VHCHTCRTISSIRKHWIDLPCRDCGKACKYFSTFLVVRLMDEVNELKRQFRIIHDENTYLLNLISKYHPPNLESLQP
jgi:hypothetical protein